jgi:hypothetical protein
MRSSHYWPTRLEPLIRSAVPRRRSKLADIRLGLGGIVFSRGASLFHSLVTPFRRLFVSMAHSKHDHDT